MKTIITTILTLFFAISANAKTDLRGDHKAMFTAYSQATFWQYHDSKFEEIAFDHLSCYFSGTPQNPGPLKCDGNQAFNTKAEAFRGQDAVNVFNAFRENFTLSCNSQGCMTNEINGYCAKARKPYSPFSVYSYRCISDYFCEQEDMVKGKCSGKVPLSDYVEIKKYNPEYRQ